jgi:trans-aconitate methyltransferase
MSQLFTHILDFPTAYRSFQNWISSGRVSFHQLLANYIKENFHNYRIVDIGCADAVLAQYLDQSIDYTGIDYNPKYIEKAKKQFPHFNFLVTDVEDLEINTDKIVYLLIGVVHHLNDEQVINLMNSIKQKSPHSIIICLDGVRVPNQNFIAKILKDLDRGNFVRTAEAYNKILEGFDFAFRSDMLSLPYNHIISTYNLDASDFNQYISDNILPPKTP